MNHLTIPWGAGELPLELPPAWNHLALNVASPDLGGAISNYEETLARGLDQPLGLDRLEHLARGANSVAIVVDDPSRWTPIQKAIPLVLERLRAGGVSADRIAIVFGVGRHHAVDRGAMERRLGAGIVDRFACFSPPVDDRSAYAELGVTSDGIPVRVFRPVAEADLRILVGSVLPHMQAGFGGGWKLIFPGTSHRSTLGALHAQGLDQGGDAVSLLGTQADANPMRRAIASAARLLSGQTFSVSHVLGPPGCVLDLATGAVDLAQTRMAMEAQRRFEAAPAPLADMLIVGNSPWPGDPMQSFKALLAHRAGCRVGGALVGLFWTDPNEIDRSFSRRGLRLVSATGTAGGWFIRRGVRTAEQVLKGIGSSSHFMLRWARELVVDRQVLVYSPPLHEVVGSTLGPIRVFDRLDELWETCRRIQPERIRIFPQGGLTYCRGSAPRA